MKARVFIEYAIALEEALQEWIDEEGPNIVAMSQSLYENDSICLTVIYE